MKSWNFLVLLLAGASSFTFAQSAADGAAAQSTAALPNPPLDYHPSFGDLMTMAVQPRHIKLGLAAKAGNWAYAAYELSELRNAFARIARTIPKYQTMDTAVTFAALTTAPLDAVQQAIAAGDVKQFSAAYGRLTNACNACHASQNHAAVIIKVPDAAAYGDQDFRSLSQ